MAVIIGPRARIGPGEPENQEKKWKNKKKGKNQKNRKNQKNNKNLKKGAPPGPGGPTGGRARAQTPSPGQCCVISGSADSVRHYCGHAFGSWPVPGPGSPVRGAIRSPGPLWGFWGSSGLGAGKQEENQGSRWGGAPPPEIRKSGNREIKDPSFRPGSGPREIRKSGNSSFSGVSIFFLRFVLFF